jgi:F0F1-type ATP synthase beta subunit
LGHLTVCFETFQVGPEHYNLATAVQKLLQDYKGLQDIIASESSFLVLRFSV